MKRTREQAASVEEEPRTPREGEALVKDPEECKSLCIEHNREHKGYYPEEVIAEGEEEKVVGQEVQGQGVRTRQVRTQLLKARAQVEHLQDPEEELWLQLHPVCRCGLLVEH